MHLFHVRALFFLWGGQASTTTHVSADAVRMINILNAKASIDNVSGNLLALAE